MSLQQIFSIVLFLISLAGVLGACSLQLFRDRHVGPGFFPLVYSAVLLVLSVVFFFCGKGDGKVDLKTLFHKPASDGTVFFLLFIASLIIMYLTGTYPALAFLAVAGLGYQKKMKMWRIVLFTLVFLGVVFLVFSLLLKIPLEQGILFR